MTQYQPQGFKMLPTAVKHLIIINAIVYLADYVLQMRGLSLTRYMALFSVDTHGFQPWQPLTYMFMHGNLTHLVLNMFMLWMFGTTMENFWGTRRFVIYYLLCGIGAGILNALIPGIHLSVGASGAIYGILLAFGMTFPNERIYLYFLVPLKAKWMITGMVVLELIEGLFFTYDGVAHFAHLFGMLVGLCLILWWRKHPFSRF